MLVLRLSLLYLPPKTMVEAKASSGVIIVSSVAAFALDMQVDESPRLHRQSITDDSMGATVRVVSRTTRADSWMALYA